MAIIPLTEDVSTKSTVASLADSLDLSGSECPDDRLWTIRCADLRKSYRLLKIFLYSGLNASKRHFNFDQSLTKSFTLLLTLVK